MLQVKIERVKRGLSQKELAENTGLHQTCISRIETGKSSPTIDKLRKIAKALNVGLFDILQEVS